MADRRVRVILQAEIAQFQQGMRQAQSELGQVAQTADRGEKRMGGMGSTITGRVIPAVAGMVGGFQVFDKVLKAGFERFADIEDAEQRMKQMGLSTSEVNDLMAGLTDTVTGTAFSLNDGASVMAKFVASGMDIDDVNDRLTMTADTAAFAQAPLNEIGDIFQRIQSEGQLSGETLNMLQVRGVPALQLLASAAGTSELAMRDMISQGMVDADQFFGLWEAGSKGFGENNIKIEGAAQSMGETIRGALANASTALARIGEEMLDDFIPAIHEGAEAFKEFGTVAVDALDEVDRFTEKTGLEKAKEKIKDFNVTGAEFFENLAESAEKSNDVITTFFREVFGVENVNLMTVLGDETENAADKTRMFRSAAAGAKGEASELAGETDELAQAAKDAEQAIEDLTTALFDSGREAIALEEQQDALRDAIDAAKEAADGQTGASRDERSALRDVAKESQDLIETMIDQEASTKDVRAATESARTKFLEVADAMGIPQDEAETLADKYGLIPDEVETQVDLIGDARAKARAAEVKASIDAIKSKSVTVTIEERRIKSTYVNTYFRTFGTQGVGGQSAHTGGLLTSSGLKRFHGGGMSDSATLGLRPDERILIAQTGERILSRQQTALFDPLIRMMGNTAMAIPMFHSGGTVGTATTQTSPPAAPPASLKQIRRALDGMTLFLEDRRGQTVARVANLYGRTS